MSEWVPIGRRLVLVVLLLVMSVPTFADAPREWCRECQEYEHVVKKRVFDRCSGRYVRVDRLYRCIGEDCKFCPEVRAEEPSKSSATVGGFNITDALLPFALIVGIPLLGFIVYALSTRTSTTTISLHRGLPSNKQSENGSTKSTKKRTTMFKKILRTSLMVSAYVLLIKVVWVLIEYIPNMLSTFLQQYK